MWGAIASLARSPWAVTWAITIAALIYMEWIALTQFLTSRWYLADVGNIHYCLFNTLHGRFMASPMHDHLDHFGFHFTPFLLLLLPIVPLSAYPIPLVTTYVVALALFVPAVHWLAEREEISPWLRPALALFFLSNHFTGSLELANHFEVFFVLFFVLTIAARSSRWLYLCALLTILVKEDAALWLAAWAVFEWWHAADKRQRRQYAAVACACVAYALVAISTMLVIQKSQGGGAVTEYGPRLAGGGFGRDTLITVATLVASFLFLPLLSGRYVVLLLVPLPLLLTGFPFMRSLAYYYSYPFLPFLALTTCVGAKRLLDWKPRWMRRDLTATLGIILCLAAAAQWFLPTRTDGYCRIPFSVTSRDWYRLEVARDVLPREARVALQFGLWGITPTRLGAHLLSPRELEPQDYVFIDLSSPHGLEREEFIQVARQVIDEAESGKRHYLHRAYDVFVLSPVVDKK